MSDRMTLRDYAYRWRHRVSAIGAAISLYRAMTWRRRSGIWVCWTSLESDEERKIFMDHLAAAMFDAWHAARDKRHFMDPVTTEVVEAGLSVLDNIADVPPENES
jgi:2'-5' RNA ligase